MLYNIKCRNILIKTSIFLLKPYRQQQIHVLSLLMLSMIEMEQQVAVELYIYEYKYLSFALLYFHGLEKRTPAFDDVLFNFVKDLRDLTSKHIQPCLIDSVTLHIFAFLFFFFLFGSNLKGLIEKRFELVKVAFNGNHLTCTRKGMSNKEKDNVFEPMCNTWIRTICQGANRLSHSFHFISQFEFSFHKLY